MATAECETVAAAASETRDKEIEEEYPLVVEYCGLCTMPPEVKPRYVSSIYIQV